MVKCTLCGSEIPRKKSWDKISYIGNIKVVRTLCEECNQLEEKDGQFTMNDKLQGLAVINDL